MTGLLWAAVWASVSVLLQGVLIIVVIRFVNKLGAYTDALLRTHESNRTVHEFNVRLIDELRKAREDQQQKGAA